MCDSNNENQGFDLNNLRYVGWESQTKNMPQIQYLTSPELIAKVSNKITELLQGVHPEGKDIVVPDFRISETLVDIYNKTMPLGIGDIYTREIHSHK